MEEISRDKIRKQVNSWNNTTSWSCTTGTGVSFIPTTTHPYDEIDYLINIINALINKINELEKKNED